MKREIILAISVLFCCFVQAQSGEDPEHYQTIVSWSDDPSYQYFPKLWRMMRIVWEDGERKREEMTITLGGDSIVSEKRYVKVICQTETNDTIATLLYRQDGDCVYCLNEEKEDVKVLDYSVKEGDIFTSADGMEWEVTETGLIKNALPWSYPNPAPRMFRLQNRDGRQDIWVEGAGSLEWGIVPTSLTGQSDDEIIISRLNSVAGIFFQLEYNWGEEVIPTIVHRSYYSPSGYSYDNLPKTWFTHYAVEVEGDQEENVTLWLQNRNDTLIGEKNYLMMVMGRYEMENFGTRGRPQKHEPTDTLYYRQEGSQVFMRDPATAEDVLLFDYSLMKGDKFVSADGTEWQVTSTSIEDYNTKSNSIYLSDKNGNVDVWTEGVGSEYWGILPDSFIRSSGIISGNFKSHLRSMASKEVSVSYDVNEDNYKYIFFFPNTTLTDEQKDSPYGLSLSFKGDRLCVQGRQIWEFGLSHVECEIKGDSINIMVTMDDTYLYAYFHSDVWVYVVIPGFHEGTYHVKGIASYSGYPLSDATIFEEVLICGNPDGIEEVPSPLATSPRVGTAIYDLQGRKVEKPEKGIYIVNGRKVMIK